MTTNLPQPWYYRPFWVVVLLFLVLGPFGLPLLWRSQSFTRGWKIVLTLAVLAETVWLLDQVLVTTRLVMEHLERARPR